MWEGHRSATTTGSEQNTEYWKSVFEVKSVEHSMLNLSILHLFQFCMFLVFQPRKALLDQLSSVFDSADENLPDSLFLVSTSEWQGQMLAQKMQDRQLMLICTSTEADVKAAICFLVTKIQKL